jgi:Domain of unknown function (DUF4214)
VAYGFAASPEREGLRIGADYKIYLGRDLDAGGQAYWVIQFLSGARNEDVVGGFVGSPEYYQNTTKGRSNRTAWIDSAFQDIFHRDPPCRRTRLLTVAANIEMKSCQRSNNESKKAGTKGMEKEAANAL